MRDPEELRPVFRHEAELGIEQDVNATEEAFQISCDHNDTHGDMDYWRRYMFSLFALHFQRIEELEKEVERLKEREGAKCHT